MIEKLKESHGIAVGYKVHGQLTGKDLPEISTLIETTIAANKHPIGVLADLSDMHGATWAARWEEMRFLQHHSNRIARIAIVCHDEWQEISEMTLIATSFMQAETIYCRPTEIMRAWHWVRMNKIEPSQPLRVVYPGKGLFQDYTPEYIGL